MKTKIQISLIVFQALAALVFFVAGWKADRALDKSGIGDPEIFSYWNAIATHGIRVFLLMWVAAIAIEIVAHVRNAGPTTKGIMQTRLPLYVAVPPLVVSVLCVISIL